MDNKSIVEPEVSVQPAKGLFIPRYLLPVYALLLIAIGWFSGQHWRNNEAFAAPALTQVVPSAVVKTEMPRHTVTNADIETAHDENKPAQQVGPDNKVLPSLASDELAPLRYSAHVYASEDDKRSITLNGQRYQEGDSPAPTLRLSKYNRT
ncbi:Uncharacterised protein [Serratia fonticola]|uniref:Type II secretion system protein GspB C-terminal domain-containing protein n=1 Tax=Serratia fonticola TaxID=47917 RepID=A0A3S4XRD5_SERFO|nr:Uncharacterised protein [Serratia fonticola]